MDESNEDYFARLNIEDDRKIFEKNQRKISTVFRRTRRHLSSGMDVCEIGIGNGYLLSRLSDFGVRVTGIDVSLYLISHVRKKFRLLGRKVNLIQGDISQILLDEQSFDVIFALDILEHLPGNDLKRAIEAIKVALRVEGILVATFPFRENLAANMTKCPRCGHIFHKIGHFHAFNSLEDIQKTLGNNFQIIKHFNVYSLGLRGLVEKTYLLFKDILSGEHALRTICIVAQRSR